MNQKKEKYSTSLRTNNVRDISESLGKLPPQATDLEEAVLGALMLETNALSDVIEFLRVDHFYSEQHKEIFTAIIDLFKESNPVDMRTVVAQLRKNGKLEIVGGAYYIADLTSKVSSVANIEYHARIIIEMAIKRSLITAASEIHHDAYDDTTDVFDLLEKAMAKLDLLSGKENKGNFKSIFDISQSALQKIVNQRQHGGVSGIPSGFTKLDRVTAGWQKTDLVVVAGRPGMGKTAWMMSTALNIAVDGGIPTAIFSLEMGEQQLAYRSYGFYSEVDNLRIFHNYISDDELLRIGDAADRIKKAPMFIDDTPAISIFDFSARARRLVREHGIEIIFVDYLQLMTGDKEGTRDNEIGSISRGLKRVAKELNIPVIAMCQLSRAVESRGGDKRPQLSDLRESGNIEQDADIVMFLYRPEYYKIEQDEHGMPTQGLLETIIAKHRNGGLETVGLKFIGKYTKVTDWDSSPQAPTSTFGGTMKKVEPKLDSGYRSPLPEENESDPPF